MEQIDWSKAPEGATHWDAGINGRTAGWMRLENGDWYWWPAKDSYCDRKWYSSINQYSIEREGFIARPSSWEGEGLPPVGTVCEYNNYEPHPVDVELNWSRVEIVCHHTQGKHTFAVFASLSGYHGNRDPKCFRPIRTPEQIAAEERNKGILEMLVGYS